MLAVCVLFFFFSSRRRHTRCSRDWSSDVCSSDLPDHHIAYRYAIYSAPDSTCPPGTKLEVRGDSKLVRLYRRGALVKGHPRKPRGGRSTDPQDYPAEKTAY